MAAVTEFVLLPIKPDAAPEAVASVIQANIATLLAQPGCQRVRSSRTHEDPNKLRLFADWASLEAHRTFAANAAAYGPFLQRMGGIVDAASFGPTNPRRPPFHVEFAAPPPTALDGDKGKSPIAEVLQVYYPSDVSEARRAEIYATTADFLGKLGAVAKGLMGEVALGWSVETDILFKGEKSRALVAVIGWTSYEAHMQTRDTEEFKKLIPMVRDIEGVVGMEMFHVSNVTTEGGQ
ncbi:uncharacterized protein GGS22DRAFT_153079 [Annulohypoxylon maeteangense]|uniref:uncharacterized protein n=1 Tax=Annulohypoxylon maeteangense TaxID=1927788 RepID=UPI0020080C95|nr:uncharacterized protein GGS22DRAFT_153079 [Annulohypoxylon maeteangense]KAI0889081.1 hypothetical protein GGS22DRAFT_153079 [Annulohypoxylon maeteangense]